MYGICEMACAVEGLPDEIRHHLANALADGRYRIGALVYQSELAVCPMVAAAMDAGIWTGDGIADGHPAWGDPDGPSDAVEEFAICFDMEVLEVGLDGAVQTVRTALAEMAPR
jgi:hypothetical protein